MELKEEKATGTTSAEKRMGATPPPTSHPGEDDDDAVRPAKRRDAAEGRSGVTAQGRNAPEGWREGRRRDDVRPAKRRAARRSGAAQVRNKKFQSGQKIYLCRPRSASLALDRQYTQAHIAATLRERAVS